jgi:CheY-like chemotaxis protein
MGAGDAGDGFNSGLLDKTVLIADDDVLVRKVLSRMLAKLGCNVLLAEDGLQAIELFKENIGAVDLMLIDMRMPNADGSAVVQHVRATSDDVKMILMGGGEEVQHIDEQIAAGFSSVLPKPFDISAIRSELSRLLGQPTTAPTGQA